MAGQTLPRNTLADNVLKAWDELVDQEQLPRSVRFVIINDRLEAHVPGGGRREPTIASFFWTGKAWQRCA